MSVESIKEKLNEFIRSDKFKVYQNLQPAVENSTPDTVSLVNNIFNNVAAKLTTSLANNGHIENEVKNILLGTTDALEEQPLDTEDFEFCYELLYVLSQIVEVEVDVRNEVNQKQLDALSPEKIIEQLRNAGLDPKDFG